MQRRLLALALIFAVTAVPATTRAQIPNVHDTHFLTFDASVALPNGTTLAAGTYLFSWDPQTRVTRISSEDRATVYATLMTTPIERRNVTPKAHDVIIERSAANAPPMLRAWFCPGNPTGHQFAPLNK